MKKLKFIVLTFVLVACASSLFAADKVTSKTIEEKGGLKAAGPEFLPNLTSKLPIQKEFIEVREIKYGKFSPLFYYNITLDTDAFIAKIIKDVTTIYNDKNYNNASIILGYMLIFERNKDIRNLMTYKNIPELLNGAYERSLLEAGYKFKFLYYHKNPTTFTYTIDGDEETEVLDYIDYYQFSLKLVEDIEFGVTNWAEMYNRMLDDLARSIDTGKAKNIYNIIDNNNDEAYCTRARELMKRFK